VVTYPPATVVHGSPVTLSTSQESGTRFPVGTTAVTVTATDASGDSALCTFMVAVRDTTAPTVTCPDSITVQALGPDGAAVAYPDATASDTVTLAPTLTWSQVSGSLFPVGTTPVNAVARDDAGNAATCSFNVVVQPFL
jgi:hypothetical protein